MYRKEPKYILLYLSTNKLMEKFYSFPAQERREFAFKYLTYIEDLVSTINTKLKNSIILCCNFPEIDDTIFGNQASKTEDSFLYQCRKLNYLLSEKSVQLNHLLLVDLVGLQNRFGVGHLFNGEDNEANERDFFGNNIVTHFATVGSP